MIDDILTAVVALAGAAAAGWFLRRARARRAAAGPAAGIPCMARRPAGEGRWRPGRVHAVLGAPRFESRRGGAVPLGAVQAGGVRAPSVREGMSINPGSRIVTCATEGATIEIAVMALDLRELMELLEGGPTERP
ncbi:hypothetical protein [Streptomyces sp. NPDC012746]|uniref:hypothetical protein n=1 Tax=Streptomyces sp. NPDC012746 TaxID=3364845 RepID=UPI0036C005E8